MIFTHTKSYCVLSYKCKLMSGLVWDSKYSMDITRDLLLFQRNKIKWFPSGEFLRWPFNFLLGVCELNLKCWHFLSPQIVQLGISYSGLFIEAKQLINTNINYIPHGLEGLNFFPQMDYLWLGSHYELGMLLLSFEIMYLKTLFVLE